MINQIFHQLTKQWLNPQPDPSKNLQLVGQISVIGRKFKQISSAKLSNWQWFLLLYVAGTGCLLLLVTFLKFAMKLI
ncbi:hypothetical protein EOE67_01940 [Rheinheimera riviphila]|uniref:Uncharacterized protein n=1 Tax=Rheinheimera riviphila TaxID=1834037 RepID=A0A437R5C9_9GAMM|nr:hypothetical protein [Rheinheimera riviphila]RVU41974.1 hypothetical protein EOE67_01940 [Rheinheimera riviphila]